MSKKNLFCLLIVVIALSGCGSAKAGSARADLIPGPSRVNCYLIRDDEGRGVGGNCIPVQ